jgi:maltose alpha-D-glucosyltransferase / alpha-amylase
MTALAPSVLSPVMREALEAEAGIDRRITDWYKDAIIYQLHVKAFLDSTGDGVGDFHGLMQRLDYIESLGVNAVWLLPFYPSPLRDDGYDISDYRGIHTFYGDLVAFESFLRETHRRGIRVLTELVINHSSDQHPWFQRARKAAKGSAHRDFYVWSDTDERYAGTRIIFVDTEKSNWAWDSEANAYYWHRFYSHQPDLNFDNPAVLEEVIEIIRFWLDLGVDGLRLDAVPYLCEREGTNNENLPQTHEILRRIRREVDKYSDRPLLAEANQWPEDARPYFGEGDECHMAFHFPLMPRMYMAVAQEDRHPITDILRQTPQIPDQCQWALFLRNHDELTLEMVTDDERDYLWRTYATDSRARINLGIRRRLAPLLDNDRRKIELMNALLLSMPGTPVLYYGDEIGMGDNFYLGDRDGVRTPMQWSADRNGGFSHADPQRLYLPPIMDANYGFQAINVEAQQRDPSSLLNWMARMIRVRKNHAAFGRGNLEFLYPRNRKVLAYLREYEGQRLLCVFNLARSAQAVELDLRKYAGAVPIELTGNSAFPPVGDLPYMLTLPTYGFYWFILEARAEQPRWHVPIPEVLPDFITLIASDGWQRAVAETQKNRLEREALPDFLFRQRWFGAKDAHFARFELSRIGPLDGWRGSYELMLCDVLLPGDDTQRYFLPLSARWGSEYLRPGAPMLGFTCAKLRTGARVGALLDAAHDDDFIRDFVRTVGEGKSIETPNGRIEFSASPNWTGVNPEAQVRPVGTEQSNVSAIVDDRIMLKIYRRLRSGVQPELEVARYLTEVAGYTNAPAFLGAVEHVANTGDRTALAIAFAAVPNQGDAWNSMVEALDRALESLTLVAGDEEKATVLQDGFYIFPLDLAGRLGERTGDLHRAFATKTTDPAFTRERITSDDIKGWVKQVRGEAEHVLNKLERTRGSLPEATAELVANLLAARAALCAKIEAIAEIPPVGFKTRIHGDFHLGQVLVSNDDVVIIDFEGEPIRTLTERREKSSPLRDVAGMLRSLDYAASAATEKFFARTGELPERVMAAANAWRDRASRDFLQAYFKSARTARRPPFDQAVFGLLDLFLLQKAFYEIAYESANRPSWLPIPIQGVLNLVKGRRLVGHEPSAKKTG